MPTKGRSSSSSKSSRGKKTSRCWPGYTPVKGKKPFSKGSCRKSK